MACTIKTAYDDNDNHSIHLYTWITIGRGWCLYFSKDIRRFTPSLEKHFYQAADSRLQSVMHTTTMSIIYTTEPFQASIPSVNAS